MEVEDEHHRTTAAQRAKLCAEHGGHAGEEGQESGAGTKTLTLGDWVVRSRGRKRSTNPSGEEEERSEGSRFPHATAAEVARVGRSKAATARATRTPEEVEHGFERKR